MTPGPVQNLVIFFFGRMRIPSVAVTYPAVGAVDDHLHPFALGLALGTLNRLKLRVHHHACAANPLLH